MRSTLLICFILCNVTIVAQNFSFPIQYNGSIPQHFFFDYNYEKEWSKKEVFSENNRLNKYSREFYLKSNYFEDYLIRSGNLLVSTPSNNYLQEIVSYLLLNKPELQNQIHVYILKSTKYNAYITQNGNIYVNMGLLAKVKNEAQLAFILAHEISHYANNHNLNTYLEQKHIVSGKGNYRNLSYDDQLYSISSYSKSQEFTADSFAYTNFYAQSRYDDLEIDQLFQDMKYSHLPIGNQDSLITYLEKNTFQLTDKYRLTQLNPVLPLSSYNDSLGSHPNIQERLIKLKELYPSNRKKEMHAYVISKTDFVSMQNHAQKELTNLYLSNHNYESAILNSFGLLQNNNYVSFDEITIGIALEQLSVYKAKDDFEDVHRRYSNEQGYLQQLCFLTEKLSDIEIAFLALCFNLKIEDKYPDSDIIKSNINNLLNLIIFELNINPFDLVKANQDYTELVQRAIIGFPFNTYIESYTIKQVQKKKFEDKEKEDLIHNPVKRKQIANKNKLIRKHGYALGIDTIVLVNPMSNCANECSLTEIEKANNLRNNLKNTILSVSDELNLHTYMLDIKNFNNSDTDRFNDYALLSSWFNEKCSHSSDSYSVYNANFTNYLISKYHTCYFAWTMITPGIGIDFYLFNIENNSLVLSEREWFKSNNSLPKISTSLKKILTQIKTKQIN